MTPVSWLGLLFLAVILFELFPRLALDSFRQDLYKIRDDLFLYAADGKISFDDPAYKLSRDYLNGAIRYAHKISATCILSEYLAKKIAGVKSKPGIEISSDLINHFKSLNDESRQYLKNAFIEAHLLMIKLIATRSIASLPLLIIFVLANRVSTLSIKNLLRTINGSFFSSPIGKEMDASILAAGRG